MHAYLSKILGAIILVASGLWYSHTVHYHFISWNTGVSYCKLIA